jgi:hypothetical protein
MIKNNRIKLGSYWDKDYLYVSIKENDLQEFKRPV